MTGRRLSRDFTTGSIPKQLFFFMLPFMLSNALQVFYSTVDMWIVGKYVGTAGLSAVSQSSQIMNFGAMVCVGFTNAGQVVVAQAVGAGKHKELNRIIGTLFSLIVLLAVVLTAVFVIGKQWIVDVMRIPFESEVYAEDYLLICGAGMIFTAGYNMVSAVLRGMGDSKRPLLFIAIASLVNLGLDYLFTGLWGWEVAGAAWATIIGQAVSFIFAVIYLYRQREGFGFDFKLKSLAIHKKYARMIGALGTPLAIQSGCINISMLCVNAMVNDVGVVASATFGVGMRIDDIINKISMGIQHAALPMVSQNMGAGQQKRAQKVVYSAWIFSGILTVIAITAYLVFGESLFKVFSDDPLVHEMSGTFISAILWMFPALAIMRGTGGFIQGIGNAKFSMLLSILDGVLFRIGLSWLFGMVFDWGFYGFVLGYGLAPVGFAVPSMIYFLSGIWKKRAALSEKL